ncbi:aldehyde dehydrogenase family protein, partial [Micrococcus sp. GbtcB5]|uniref:aldehyde dehydrogenase family protein n=1 Tax=Micrococcus sp. GbtcB5 TaxID=2824750 RepID=UPI001C3117AA
DIDAAVAAARAAFDGGSWVRMRPNVREVLLWRVSNLITERLEDFALLESLVQGNGVGIASAFVVRAAADCFPYYAGWPSQL